MPIIIAILLTFLGFGLGVIVEQASVCADPHTLRQHCPTTQESR